MALTQYLLDTNHAGTLLDERPALGSARSDAPTGVRPLPAGGR